MPLINVNLNDAITMSSVPTGTYRGKVLKAEMGNTKAGGHRLALTFKIVSPEKVSTPQGEVETLDRQFFDGFNTLVVNEHGKRKEDSTRKSLGFLKEFLELVNCPILENGAFNTDDLINKEVWVNLVEEEYEGKSVNRVKKYFQSDRAEASARRR